MTTADLESDAVRRLGTPSEQERFAAGVLPEDELLALARSELFKPFEVFRRWCKILPSEVKHHADCTPLGASMVAASQRSAKVVFETADPDTFSPTEWENLKRISLSCDVANQHPWCRAMGESFRSDPRAHWASCSGCDAELVRHSVAVRVTWAGRLLVREYAI